MATVYRAYDERLQVYRAVKVLSVKLAKHPVIQERFLNEARTMARLHHPNIVGVHDVGSDGDRSFIVMEIVEGGSLMDYVSEHGPMHARLAADATLALLSALGVAHDAGVVHRDIKPQNILISRKGRCKVTDFGIAHVADDSSDRSLTKTGSVMGTWGFMAPEQRVSARKVDGRSDVYAVGATLYTLLTNQMPVDLFAAEMDDSVLEGIEENLAAIIKAATRYKPDDRYDDVETMHEAVKKIREDLPEPGPDIAKLGSLAAAADPRPTPPPALETKEDSGNLTMVPPGDYVAEHTNPMRAEEVAAAKAAEGGAGETMAIFGDEGLDVAAAEEPAKGPPPEVLQPIEAPKDPAPSYGTLHDGEEGGGTGLTMGDWDDEPAPQKSKMPMVLGGVALLALIGGAGWYFSQDPVEEPIAEPVEEPIEDPPIEVVEDPPIEVVEDPPVEVEDPPVETAKTPEQLERERKWREEQARLKAEEEAAALADAEAAAAAAAEAARLRAEEEARAAAEAERVKTGVVLVEGNARKVILVGSDGKRINPGANIPPGTYNVDADFGTGIPNRAMTGLVVEGGKTVTIKCASGFDTCSKK